MVESASSSEKNHDNQVKPSLIDEVNAMRKELEEERGKTDDCLNRFRYLQADFENYKKRVKKEIDGSIRYANRKLIIELLTVIDELEYAIEAGKHKASNALLKGIEITLSKLYNILEKEGLGIIETVGQNFDPVKHEAVDGVPTEKEEGKILEEVRKGYMFKEMVIRPSLVRVAVNISKKVERNEQHN